MADISLVSDSFAPSHAVAARPSWLERAWRRFRVLRRRARRDRYISALVERVGRDRAAARGVDIARYRSDDWLSRGILQSMAGADRAG